MAEQLPMMFEDLPTIAGYVPRFTLSETMLGLYSKQVQIGGGLGFGPVDEDWVRPEPKFETRYSIVVCGVHIEGDHREVYDTNSIRQSDDKFTIVAKCANAFLANKTNEKLHPAAWKFLSENGAELNQSKRYWAAVAHLAEIEAEKRKVDELLRRIERAKIVAGLRAAEVLAGRTFTQHERERKWAELSGGMPYHGPYLNTHY